MADGTRTTHWFIVKARVAIKSRRFMQSIGGLFSAVKPNRNCSRLRRGTLFARFARRLRADGGGLAGVGARATLALGCKKNDCGHLLPLSHQDCAAVYVENLPGDETGVFRAEEQ